MATQEEAAVAERAWLNSHGTAGQNWLQVVDAVDTLRARALDGPGGLIEIGERAARDYARKHSWTGKQVTEGDAEAHAETAIRAVHAHMRGAPLGYVVRWKDDSAHIGKNLVGCVYQLIDQWAWRFSLNLHCEKADSKADAQRACEAAIAEYMEGFGLVPVGAGFAEGIEAAARFADSWPFAAMAIAIRAITTPTREAGR